MSCNCNKNPCSCANANCACPPDYSVAPATLNCTGTTCDDSLGTNCVFTTQLLTCSQVPVGTDLNTTLQAMDAKICECGSCSGQTTQSPVLSSLSNFYVDSLNTVPGNGTVINPFQTLELAYAKVIGTGSVIAPQYPEVTIHVQSGQGYTTSLNIFISGITWNFLEGANVTFTGNTTYFIDVTNNANIGTTFSLIGSLNFITSTGGFLRSVGSHYSSSPNVYIEANSIYSTNLNTPTSQCPLIYQNVTNVATTGAGVPTTFIKLQSELSYIMSQQQTTIWVTGGIFHIDLSGGILGYGFNIVTGGAQGTYGQLLYYNNIDSFVSNYISDMQISNGVIFATQCTDMIHLLGYFNKIIFKDIVCDFPSIAEFQWSGTQAATFINIGNMTLAPNPSASDFTFLLDRVYIHPQPFTGGSPVINYSGVSNNFDYLQMQNCILYNACAMNAAIRLGKIVNNSSVCSTYNVIEGILNFTNLPTSSAGLFTGTIWRNGNVLTIV